MVIEFVDGLVVIADLLVVIAMMIFDEYFEVMVKADELFAALVVIALGVVVVAEFVVVGFVVITLVEAFVVAVVVCQLVFESCSHG